MGLFLKFYKRISQFSRRIVNFQSEKKFFSEMAKTI